MKGLNYFIDTRPKIVGSYKPSEHWSEYTHFAVMDKNSGEMAASCGYFQSLSHSEEWGVEHYKQAAQSIEQAQLYAAAPRMFEMLARIAAGKSLDPFKVQRLLDEITDISESAKRLLGEDSMIVIEHKK